MTVPIVKSVCYQHIMQDLAPNWCGHAIKMTYNQSM